MKTIITLILASAMVLSPVAASAKTCKTVKSYSGTSHKASHSYSYCYR